jgi:hypothetical protein
MERDQSCPPRCETSPGNFDNLDRHLKSFPVLRDGTESGQTFGPKFGAGGETKAEYWLQEKQVFTDDLKQRHHSPNPAKR